MAIATQSFLAALWAPEQTHRSLNTFILSLIRGWTEHWGRYLHQGHGTKEFLPALAFLFLQSSSSFSFAVLRTGFGGFGGSPGFICKEKSVTLSPGQHDLCLLSLIDLNVSHENQQKEHQRALNLLCIWTPQQKQWYGMQMTNVPCPAWQSPNTV